MKLENKHKTTIIGENLKKQDARKLAEWWNANTKGYYFVRKHDNSKYYYVYTHNTKSQYQNKNRVNVLDFFKS